MVKKIFNYIMCALMIICAHSCTEDSLFDSGTNNGKQVRLTINADFGTTRTIYNPGDITANWELGDNIGVLAMLDNTTFTDAVVNQFIGNQQGVVRKTTFTGPVTDKGPGSYKLYAMSPYVANTYTNNLHFLLRPYQTPDDETWDPRTDLMLGVQHNDAVVCPHSVSELGAQTIDFNHKFGWLKLTVQGATISKDAGKRINYVRIYAPNDFICGDFNIDLKNQNISLPNNKGYKTIIADVYDRNVTLQDIANDGIWFTMKPGTYNDIRIAFKLVDGNYTQFARISTEGDNPLVIQENNVTEALLKQKSDHTADSWSTDMACLSGTMPQKSYKTDPLKILIIGNESAEGSSRYFGDLCDAEGLTNVDIYRAIATDKSLADYKNYITNDSKPSRIQRYVAHDPGNNGKNTWKTVNMDQKTMQDFLLENSFDVVILQQDMEDNSSYSTYQPALAYLQELIYNIGVGYHNKIPYLVWDMGTSFNSNHSIVSDVDYTTMYNNIVSAAQSMKAESGINMVLTPGTAIQKARNSADFSDATYKLLTNDGRVESNGHGSYLAACTWFEQLIVPIYAGAGVGTVQGNTFVPTKENCDAYNPGWDEDELSNSDCLELQKIAHATAMDNPFFSTNPYWNSVMPGIDVYVNSVDLIQHTKSIELGETYTFNPVVGPADATNKGLVWTSTNPAVASVDNNGVVTAITPGVVTIRATAIDGSNKFDECAVTVDNPDSPKGTFYVDINGSYRTKPAPFNVEGNGFLITLNKSMLNIAQGDTLEIRFTHNGWDGNSYFLCLGDKDYFSTNQHYGHDMIYFNTQSNGSWYVMSNSNNSSLASSSFDGAYLRQYEGGIKIYATNMQYYAKSGNNPFQWVNCGLIPKIGSSNPGDNPEQIVTKFMALEYFSIGSAGTFQYTPGTSIDYIKITKAASVATAKQRK